MGAVTAILYASSFSKEPVCLILDSPFCDLQKVIIELVQSRTSIPKLILDGLMVIIKKKILTVLKKDIFQLNVE